jgi:hypothetical protein
VLSGDGGVSVKSVGTPVAVSIRSEQVCRTVIICAHVLWLTMVQANVRAGPVKTARRRLKLPPAEHSGSSAEELALATFVFSSPTAVSNKKVLEPLRHGLVDVCARIVD